MIGDLLGAVLAQIEAIDLDSIPLSQVHTELVAGVVGVDRLNAALARFVQRWDASGEWASDGSKAPGARLSRETGQSRSACNRRLTTAAALAEMPTVAQAWTAGELSEDTVALLRQARVGREDYFERDENSLVELCTPLRHPDAQRAIRYWTQRVDEQRCPDGPPPVLEFVHLTPTFDGAISINGVLDPISGATVQEALRRIEDELYLADQRDGIKRSRDERSAAALVEMAVRATSAPADGKRPEPLIVIIAGEQALERVLELSTGQILGPHQVVPHLSRAQVQSFVFNQMTPIAATGRRTFIGRLRRAIQARDRRCQHPSGCDEPLTRCDVDHITPHREGGETSGDNGRLQCTVHNRDDTLHHRAPTEDTTVLIGTERIETRINDHIEDARQRRTEEDLARARLRALAS